MRSRYFQTYLFIALLSSAPLLMAQTPSEANLEKVAFGRELKVEGVIVDRSGEHVTLRDFNGADYDVVITGETDIREKKRNLFRKAKSFSSDDLIVGLKVRIEGWGNDSGSLVARKIRMTQTELDVARTVASSLAPVQGELRKTQSRLSDVEGDVKAGQMRAEQLGANVEELDEALKLARSEAKNASAEARNAQSTADRALVGVDSTQERITSLDDYDLADSISVQFDFNSRSLSDAARDVLNRFSEAVASSKGFLIEVIGFASSDGNPDYNRKLSRHRADAVIRFLTEDKQIPLRRFIVPHGFGDNKPVGDNQTLEGRRMNRRVEVRMYVNRGLKSDAQNTSM